jgi:hypothetical protein
LPRGFSKAAVLHNLHEDGDVIEIEHGLLGLSVDE